MLTTAVLVGVTTARSGAAVVPLYPNLKTLAPRELKLDRADITPDLTGVFHNVLRFSNDTYNAGDGPLIVNAHIDPTTLSGPSTQRVMNSDGTFTDIPLNNNIYWHQAHHHYHFDNWGRYQLWTKAGYDAWIASGRTVGTPSYTGVKTTSCITDEEFIVSAPNAVYPGPYGLSGCDVDGQQNIHMGLSVGWGDTYDWYRQDQWIDLNQDTLTAGQYVLRSVADPNNIVYESASKSDTTRESEQDNEATTTFSIASNGSLVDSNAPTGTVSINHVDPTTTSTNVSIDVVARDDVSGVNQFRLSNNGTNFTTFNYTSSGSVPTTVAFNLADAATGGNSNAGIHTVYAQAHDNAGNWGPVFTDTINYQSGGPPPPPPSTYSQAVANDAPASYWRLDETSGTNAADSRGSNPGVYKGSPTLGAPSLLINDGDKAATFSGTNQSVAVASSTTLSPASTVSLEAWIKPTSLPAAGAFASVVSKPESYSLQFNGPKLEFTIMQNGTRFRLQAASGAIVVGTGYHIVGTYDGTTQRLYINGALAATAALSGAITTNTNGLNIASWSGSAEFFAGTIDEVAVYPTVLSATQVATHHSAGINPAPPTAQLTVASSGTGSGVVTSAPAGISCGATCAASFNTGSTVTLSAAPNAGSVFAGWSGGGCSGTGSCAVVLSANITVTATFNPAPSTLTVLRNGAGSGNVVSVPAGINCGVTCASTFAAGTSVTLTATPAAGSAFSGWSGGGCSGTGTCTLTLNANTTLTATFSVSGPSYTLTVTPTGSGSGSVTSVPGGISCGSTCAAVFAGGASVTLTAAPAAGSVFSGWSGGGCSGTGTCIVALNANTTVTAGFAPVPTATLTVTRTGTGSGTVTSAPAGIACGATCAAPFAQGTSVTLTAAPVAGSVFSGWSGGGCSGTAACTVALNANTTVTADFEPAPTATLTVTRAGTGSGTVTSAPVGIACGATCAAPFAQGTSVTLTAVAASGSLFAGWSGGCSGTAACTVVLTANTAVTATFNPGTTYSQVVKADNPAAYWRLDETSGTVAADSKGTNTGAYKNTPTLGAAGLLASIPDKAVAFNGSNQSVAVPSAAALVLPTTVSLEAWIKPVALPAAGAFASVVTKPESYSLQFNGPRMEFTIMQAGTRRRLQAPAGAIVAGSVYHVVGTYDGITQRLYINGTQVATAALTGAITTNTNGLNIASWSGTAEFLTGTIDEVAVYPTVLTPTQITKHYTTGTTVTAALSSSDFGAPAATTLAGTSPVATGVDDALGRIYVTRNHGSGTAASNGVTVIDANTGRIVAEVTTGRWGPSSLAVDPARHLVYVTAATWGATDDHSVVVVIDGRTNRIVRRIAVAPGPKAIAVNPKTNRIYVTDENGMDAGQAVSVINGTTGKVIAVVPTGPYARYYENPLGIAVDATSNTVYATNPLQGTVYVIDGATNRITRSLAVGDEPTAVAVDTTTGRAYVAHAGRGSAKVSVVDGHLGAVVQSIRLGGSPRGVAVDAGSGTVYVSTAGHGTALVDIGTANVRGVLDCGPGAYGVTVSSGGAVIVADREDDIVCVLPRRARLRFS